MRGKRAGVTVFIALVLAAGGAFAMNAPNERRPRCHVIDGEKLPSDSGGANALCVAIVDAISAHAPGLAHSIEVRVLSASRLSATVITADGKTLPDQNFAIADRPLTRVAFAQFAQAIAAEIARAAR